jgi:GT2 family glycosyltransferase
MNQLAPIILMVYNRPEHTSKTLSALRQNKLADKSDLFIYSDGPKNEAAVEDVKQVRSLIRGGGI